MRRVVTLFEARGADQIRAQLGTMRTGFSENRREMDAWGRSGGIVNNQLRALGTTLRYTFAGSAIFGTLNMIRNLGAFQAKLGEISAIATGPGGLPVVGRELDDLGTRLLDVSNRTTQPIADLQEGVISLYSTIGNVPEDKASSMMETIAQTSIVAQSNIEDTTLALLGMLNAFQRNTDELPKFADEFYKVIQLSAGMPGHIYAQQLGRLQASAALSGFSPEQMGALAVGATRFGGSSATNMRGLAQLMTFVMNPSSKPAQAALAGIGLGTAERNRLGGMGVLTRILAEVNKRGLTGKPRGLTDDMVTLLDTTYGDSAPNSALGISGGGSELLAKIFPRIEGRRIAAVLSSLQNENQVAGTTNKTIDQYLNDVTDSAGSADKAMGRAMDYRRIQQAGNAFHNLGIEIGTAISPLLQYPARGITAGVSGFNKQKWGLGPVTGQEIELGAAGVGTFALLRALRGRGGAGGLVRGAGMAGAGLDLFTQHQRGYTPASPLYVAIVYSMSGWNSGGWRRPGNAPTGAGPYGVPGGQIGPAEGAAGRTTVATGRASRFSRAASRFRGGGMASLAALMGGDMIYEMTKPDSAFGYRSMTDQEKSISGHPLLKYLSSARAGGFAPHMVGVGGLGAHTLFRIGGHGVATPAERKVMEMFKSGLISADAAEKRLRAVTTHPHFEAAGLGAGLKGKAELTVHVEQPGVRRKTSHVTIDLFPDFTTPAPQTKGKDKSSRGG